MRGGERRRGEVEGRPEHVGKELDAAAAGRTPASKLVVQEAFSMGLLGANGRGDRGLPVGTNGASFGVVNRPESKWEGMPSELVTDVRVTCRA